MAVLGGQNLMGIKKDAFFDKLNTKGEL